MLRARSLKSFFFAVLFATIATPAQAQVSEGSWDVINSHQVPFSNLIKNPNFERGKQSITDASTIGTWDTTSKVHKRGSLKIDASSSGQKVCVLANATTKAEQGLNCAASFKYNGDGSLYKAYVDDGTNVVSNTIAALANVSAGSAWTEAMTWTCDTSAKSYRVCVEATNSSAAAIYTDQFLLGENSGVFQVSQSKVLGQVVFDGASGGNFTSTSGTNEFIPTTTGATWSLENWTSPATLSGSATAATFTLNNIEPGEYEVQCTLRLDLSQTAGRIFSVLFGLGTSRSATMLYEGSPGRASYNGELKSVVTGTSLTVNWFGWRSSGSGGDVNIGSGSKCLITRHPLVNQQAMSPGKTPWKVDATISGANLSLGSSAVSSYDSGVLESGSLTLSNNTNAGSDPSAWIGCSSTNSPTGTTCAAGNESVSLSFIPPKTCQAMSVCFFGTHYASSATSAAFDTSPVWAITQTAINSQTATATGSQRRQTGSTSQAVSGQGVSGRWSMDTCSVFPVTSTDRQMFRLRYQQPATGGTTSANLLLADGGGGGGSAGVNVRATAHCMDDGIQAPLLVNGVVAPDYAGTTRINTIKQVSANYTLTDQDETVRVNGTYTISLPSAASFKGKRFTLIQVNTSVSSAVTITPNGSDTVCGLSSIKLTGEGDTVTLQSDGAGWTDVSGGISCYRKLIVAFGDSTVDNSNCSTNPCSMWRSRGFSSVARSGNGRYQPQIVTGSCSQAPTAMSVLAIVNGTNAGRCNLASGATTSQIDIICENWATSGTGTNVGVYLEAQCQR